MDNYLTTNRWTKIKVAVVILIGLAILAFVIISLSTRQGLFIPTYTLKMRLQKVNNLQEGAPVHLAGYRVGVVEKIRFRDENNQQHIEVLLELKKTIQDRIRANSTARIATMGLVGDKFVEISLGNMAEPMLTDNDYISSETPVDFEHILSQSTDLIDDVRATIIGTKEVVEKINEGKGTLGLLLNDPWVYFDLDKMFVTVNSLAEKINKGDNTIAALIRDREIYDSLATALNNFNEITNKMGNERSSFNRFITDSTAYNDLTRSIERLDNILGQLESTDNSAGKLLNDQEMHEKLSTAIDDFDKLIKDMKENPRKYIHFSIF